MFAARSARPFAVFVAVIVAAAFLAGCVEVTMESEYNEDGSARHAFEVTIDRDNLEMLEGMGGQDEFDPEEGREEAEAAGFEFTPIDTDERVGSRIAKTFENGEDVTAAFNEIFTTMADEDDEGPAPFDAITGAFVQDGNEHRLNLTINSDILFADTAEDLGDAEENPFGDIDDFFDIAYIATMPGEIVETNGEDLGDGKVEWEIPLTGLTELTAVSETEGDGSGALIAIVALVALLLVGALVAGFLFTRRRGPTPATAGPGVATYNTAPNSQPLGAPTNTAPNASPSGTTSNAAPNAPPSGSLGDNPRPLDRDGKPGERPSDEQDTTKLP